MLLLTYELPLHLWWRRILLTRLPPRWRVLGVLPAVVWATAFASTCGEFAWGGLIVGSVVVDAVRGAVHTWTDGDDEAAPSRPRPRDVRS